MRIAHYPPYTSKYNPIEHRLFRIKGYLIHDPNAKTPSSDRKNSV
ncbi:hypothetical protein [Dolichospermum sp. UHCC 0259]